jgi:hypothetical protein
VKEKTMSSIHSIAATALALACISSTPTWAATGDATSTSPGPGPGLVRPEVVDKLRTMPRVDCILSGLVAPNQPVATARVRNVGLVTLAAGTTVVWTINGNPLRSGEVVLPAALQPNAMLTLEALGNPHTESCSARIK